jgi:hypothetical protein
MKVRVTVLTENNKHWDESIKAKYTEEQLNDKVKQAWQLMLDFVTSSGEPGEKALVESVEILED